MNEKKKYGFVERNRKRVEIAYNKMMDVKKRRIAVEDVMRLLYTLEDKQLGVSDLDEQLRSVAGVSKTWWICSFTLKYSAKLLLGLALILCGLVHFFMQQQTTPKAQATVRLQTRHKRIDVKRLIFSKFLPFLARTSERRD